MARKRITFVGEGMVELSGAGGGWKLGYGGDTLNSAIHMARLGCNVAFATALGSDEFSGQLREAWVAEGLDCSPTIVDPVGSVGLYAISLDAAGERNFTYWRGESAARKMFSLEDTPHLLACAAETDLLVFSLISLAILPEDGRRSLLALARKVRECGGQVAFDGNYRARLWPDKATAEAARDQAIAVSTIGLPTLEDEMALAGAQDAEEVAQHWHRLGCEEVIVKLGSQGCRLPDGTTLLPPVSLAPVDTSGAGDAFNAAYLARRMGGDSPAEAAVTGHALAGWTIMRPGAIPSRDPAAPYA